MKVKTELRIKEVSLVVNLRPLLPERLEQTNF